MEQPAIRAAATSTPAPRLDPRRLLGPLGIVAAVLAVDQGTKWLIRQNLAIGEYWPHRDALLAISHVENSGAAFGMWQGGGLLLLGASVIGLVGLLVYLWRNPPRQPLYVIAFSLILGGAFGNMIDRVTKGTVTDFIDPTRYPAFNIADSAIVCGIAAVVVLTFLDERNTARNGTRDEVGR